MKFGKTLLVGLKAIGGSIVAGIANWLIMIIAAFFTGEGVVSLLQNRPNLLMVLILVMLLVNIYILGFIYNKFWGWK